MRPTLISLTIGIAAGVILSLFVQEGEIILLGGIVTALVVHSVQRKRR